LPRSAPVSFCQASTTDAKASCDFDHVDLVGESRDVLDRERLAAGHRNGVAEQPLGRPGVVADRLRDHLHLTAGVADRLAGVSRLELCQLLVAGTDRLGQDAEMLGAFSRGDGAPRGVGRLRAGDGLVHLRHTGARLSPPAPPRWRAR